MNKSNSQKKGILRWLVVSVVVITILLLMVFPMAEGQWSNQIIRFERYNPVYAESVKVGTQREELTLPEYIRAIVPVPEDMDIATFVQAQPEVDMSDGYEHYTYFQYGYIAPSEMKVTETGEELAIYELLYDGQEDASGVGEVAYRVYGSVEGSENVWFACEVDGSITGVVLDVPVAWTGDYSADASGEYIFTAECSTYEYSGEAPTAVIRLQEDGGSGDGHDNEDNVSPEVTPDDVKEPDQTKELDEIVEGNIITPAKFADDCHCSPDGGPIDEDNFPWAHQEDCVYFSPIECMCREQIEKQQTVTEEDGSSHIETTVVSGEFSHVHVQDNKDCPLYGKSTVDIIKSETGEKSVMSEEDATRMIEEHKKNIENYTKIVKFDIVKGSEKKFEEEDKIENFSNNGGGVNDVLQDAFMRNNTPTSDNASYISIYTNGLLIPGAWVDYVNTIWMNKAYPNFSWTDPSEMSKIQNQSWAWSGTTASSYTGTVMTNQMRVPVKSGSFWNVYSGEQLRYALVNFMSGDIISIKADINLNGSQYSWSEINLRNGNLAIIGNDHTIYNFGQLVNIAGWDSFVSSFLVEYNNLTMTNLNFVSCKMVSNQDNVGLLRSGVNPNNQIASMTNVHIYDSLFYSSSNGQVSPFGFIQSNLYNAELYTKVNMRNCSTEGNYIYGRDHVSAFAIGLGNSNAHKNNSLIYNSFAADNLLCGTGGHSAGFSSCYGYETEMEECFAVNEIYGSSMVSGFVGFPAEVAINCYASGKLEGYARMAGFAWDSAESSRSFNNCYSTVLVGLRTNPTEQGGFIVGQTDTHGGNNMLINCYAAGEVGNFDVDLDNPKTVGGFYSTNAASSRYAIINCYYDKQTSAMREWAGGDNKNRSGITGVLTSTTDKGGTGLASGTWGNSSDKGFRGFTQQSDWTMKKGYYPQLHVFSNAGTNEWGSAERASRVKAYSLASTSTIQLDTWDSGYDWSDDGIRSGEKVSYKRSLESLNKTAHKGNQYTYDTVREIITDVPLSGDGTWEHMIPGGAPIDTDGDGVSDGTAMELTDDNMLHVKAPGMDWLNMKEVVEGQTGSRAIRLISYMELKAGEDKQVTAGYKYDHRNDVRLTMMDKITENLVVGMDDNLIWSVSKTGGYPDIKKFWAAPTTNMETDFSASKDAWMYTEIWRAKQNPDGSFVKDNDNGMGNEKLVPDLSVKVTGSGTQDGTTISEQKWNGEFPFNEDISKSRKYIITYYWMLADGRYRTDTKTITVDPAQYRVAVDVKNELDNSQNSTALHLGAEQDNQNNTAYSYSATALGEVKIEDVPYTKNTSVAWKKTIDTVVIKGAKLVFTAKDGTVMGSKVITGNLKEGDLVTIPITYYYNDYEYDNVQGKERESTKMEVANVSYTVQKDTNQGYYLRFNKIANIPADESADVRIGDSTGIASGVKAYINDVKYNIDLTLFVKEGIPFEFIKTDEKGDPLTGAEFQIYECVKGHTDATQHSLLAGNDSSNCWDIEHPKYTVSSEANGKVFFEVLTTGDYMMAETKTKEGYQLPHGQWLLKVNVATDTIDITARGVVPPAFKLEDDGSLSLANYPVMVMPRAGGFGILFFTVGGIALMGTAVILMIVCRRKKDLTI